MGVGVILQALAWVAVLSLVTLELLIRRGRVDPGGPAFRVAACAAAGCVVTASLAEGLWPVAVIGLLWLRTEVWHLPLRIGRRAADAQEHLVRSPDRAAAFAPRPAAGRGPAGRAPAEEPSGPGRPQLPLSPHRDLRLPPLPPLPHLHLPPLHLPDLHLPDLHLPHPHLPYVHLPHPHLPRPHLPHLPHPHLSRRVVDVVFRIEMALVIGIALVFFGIWSEQQRESFRNDTNRVVCNWMREC